jgi:hypothetical protein
MTTERMTNTAQWYRDGLALAEEVIKTKDAEIERLTKVALEITEDARKAEEEAEELRAKLNGAEERARLLFDAKNEWAKRARAAEGRCARLAAAGLVLSEHVDKAPACDMSLRDEFAKAALHAYLTSPHLTRFVEDETAARRAYEISDEMMKARDAGGST